MANIVIKGGNIPKDGHSNRPHIRGTINMNSRFNTHSRRINRNPDTIITNDIIKNDIKDPKQKSSPSKGGTKKRRKNRRKSQKRRR
jgi:hypothetical protein